MRPRKRPIDWMLIFLWGVYVLLTLFMIVAVILPVWSATDWIG